MMRALERPPVLATECGGAPPSRATVYSRTLQRACEIVGGPQALAKHLKVEQRDLARWIGAQALPPMDVFLVAVDVVLLHADRGRGRA
jgi:hypothetical protein